jgi:hypothetical protein
MIVLPGLAPNHLVYPFDRLIQHIFRLLYRSTWEPHLATSSIVSPVSPLQPEYCSQQQWQSTQTQMKMTLQRNVYGIALPLRTMIEKRIVAEVSSLILISWNDPG